MLCKMLNSLDVQYSVFISQGLNHQYVTALQQGVNNIAAKSNLLTIKAKSSLNLNWLFSI